MLLLEYLQCTVGQEASPALIPSISLSFTSWLPSDCQVKEWGWEEDTDLHLPLSGLSLSGCNKFLILSWENGLILSSSCSKGHEIPTHLFTDTEGGSLPAMRHHPVHSQNAMVEHTASMVWPQHLTEVCDLPRLTVCSTNMKRNIPLQRKLWRKRLT